MNDQQIHKMQSDGGYGAVINGNFVSITYWHSAAGRRYDAHVSAFRGDRNSQYRNFDNLAEAVEWAAAAAESHQGQARPGSKVIHWEMKHSYAVTVAQTDDGEYESETVQMNWDVDHPSPLRDFKKFPTFDEALQHARDSVDEYLRQEEDHQRIVREIGDALAAQTGILGTGA